MLLYRSPTALQNPQDARVVSIGVFDGIHIGHQKLINETTALASTRGARSMVLTFEPMPREYLSPDEPPARLTRFRERFELIAALGVDEMCCLRFDSVQALTKDAFIDTLLVSALGASAVVVGEDFRFGRKREGTVDDLIEASRLRDFDVRVISPVIWRGKRVSSTAVRQALKNGDFNAVRKMLARDYAISGRVMRGLGLGKDLGFPTANIALKRRTPPVHGVFAVRVAGLAEQSINGVASVGTRPTVGGREPLLEVHLFDFDGDIYGRQISVSFVSRLRDEKRFDDLDAMRVQMEEDAVAARAALTA
jgi:riboflavin kinase / FMN adenylyltransferase